MCYDGFLNGCLHWVVEDDLHIYTTSEFILSFDFINEALRSLSLASFWLQSVNQDKGWEISNYGGVFCCLPVKLVDLEPPHICGRKARLNRCLHWIVEDDLNGNTISL